MPGKKSVRKLNVFLAPVFLLLFVMLVTGCASTRSDKRVLEDYLEPPAASNRFHQQLYQKAKHFLVSLYNKREYHLTYIKQEKGEGVSHSKMCVDHIDTEIRKYIWPETRKDLQDDSRSILSYLNKELGCHSVRAPRSAANSRVNT